MIRIATAQGPSPVIPAHKNYILVIAVALASLALLLLIAYPKPWFLTLIGTIFADQAIVALFAIICAALAVSLLIYPVLSYLKTAQQRRIEIIKGFFSSELVVEYFRHFWMGRNGVRELVQEAEGNHAAEEKVREKFDGLMAYDFGMGHYRFPLAVLLAVSWIVMFIAFTGGFSLAAKLSGKEQILSPPLGIPVDLVSIAAIFGAYIWVTSDAILRSHHGAIHASDLAWYALRLVIAVPLGQAISMAAGTDVADGQLGAPWAAFFAFVISMFSLERINQILGTVANRAFRSELVSNSAELDDLVIRLPGVDERTANLLRAEGVTTIAQVVAADPVRLSIRTALPFEYVLSLVDAGILWKYVREKLDALSAFGLKGASSVLGYGDDVRRAAPVDAVVERLTGATAALAAAEQNDRSAREAAAEQPADPLIVAAAQAAATELEGARKALTEAEKDLRAAMTRSGQLLQDIADTTQMKVSGLEQILADIQRNSYARFICRLIG